MSWITWMRACSFTLVRMVPSHAAPCLKNIIIIQPQFSEHFFLVYNWILTFVLVSFSQILNLSMSLSIRFRASMSGCLSLTRSPAIHDFICSLSLHVFSVILEQVAASNYECSGTISSFSSAALNIVAQWLVYVASVPYPVLRGMWFGMHRKTGMSQTHRSGSWPWVCCMLRKEPWDSVQQ